MEPGSLLPAATSLYAGLGAIIIVILGFGVVRQRRRHQVGVGTGGNDAVELACRVHGNAVENIPIGIALLWIFETNGAPAWAVHVVGSLFVLARIAHATGLSSSRGATPGRLYGMLGTWGIMLLLAVAVMVQFVMGLIGA